MKLNLAMLSAGLSFASVWILGASAELNLFQLTDKVNSFCEGGAAPAVRCTCRSQPAGRDIRPGPVDAGGNGYTKTQVWGCRVDRCECRDGKLRDPRGEEGGR